MNLQVSDSSWEEVQPREVGAGTFSGSHVWMSEAHSLV